MGAERRRLNSRVVSDHGPSEGFDQGRAPTPAAPRHQHDMTETLEHGHDRNRQQRSGDDGDEALDEVGAPIPALRQSRSNDRLEDAGGGRGGVSSTATAYARPHEDEAEKSPTPSPPPPNEGEEGLNPLATRFYILSHLVLASFLGTLARLGLQTLTFYPGAPTSLGVLWPNFAGSVIMGFLAEDRRLFVEEWGPHRPHSSTTIEKDGGDDTAARKKKAHSTTKKTIPLFIGLATGFCGSFTSFSSFMRDAMLALSNDLPSPLSHPHTPTIKSTTTVPRSRGNSVMALLAVILLTVCLCLSGLQGGAHLALALEKVTPSIPFRFTRRLLDPFVGILAWGCWLAAILLSIWPPDRPGGSVGAHRGWDQETWRSQALFSLVFAPLGCLARYWVSGWLNPRISSFPLGTFVVNVVGTIILGAVWDLQRVPVGGVVACQVFQGIEDGFCGCLTTVSTWMLELKGLKRRHAYRYGVASVAVSLVFLVVVMGSMRWSKGWAEKVCLT